MKSVDIHVCNNFQNFQKCKTNDTLFNFREFLAHSQKKSFEAFQKVDIFRANV